MIEIKVTAADARLLQSEALTVGRVGLGCRVYFDPSWDGLDKVAVCSGSSDADVLLLDEEFTVPGECLQEEGISLSLGFYGTDGSGETVIPTVWVNCGEIRAAAEPAGAAAESVTPALAAQILAEASRAAELAASVRRDADAGRFRGEPGRDGLSPTLTVEDIPGGHRIRIRDAQGEHSVDVMDGAGGDGCGDYDELDNKPSLNGVEIAGSKTAADYGLAEAADIPETAEEVAVFHRAFATYAEIEAAVLANKVVLILYQNRIYRVVSYAVGSGEILCTAALGANIHSMTLQRNGSWTGESVTVSPGPASTLPAALGAPAAGASERYARADHVHPMPDASDVGAAPAVTEVTVSAAGAVAQALDAGKNYHFTGALTALTITLNAAAGPAQYHFDFLSGSTAPTLTLPDTVNMPDGFSVEANKRYEVDILGGYGIALSWGA